MDLSGKCKLINPDEVQEAIKDLKVGKTPRTKGNTEQILEASSSVSGIPPRRDIQHGSPYPSLSYSVEACPSDLYT